MKRIFLILAILLIIFSLNAQNITLLHEGDTLTPGAEYPSVYQRAARIVEKEYPGVKVDLIQGTVQGALDITLETMVASGQAPNVVSITVMRASKFFRPGQALDLKLYAPEALKKYLPTILSRVTRDGKVYAFPMMNSPLGLSLNLNLAKEAGFKVPAPGANWTMDQFMEYCRLLKEKGKVGTIFFSASNPIPYVTAWWTSFGVEFFKNNDYSKVAINSPQTRAALAWMKDMMTKGYVQPNPSQLIDDDMVALWASGKVGAQPVLPGFFYEIDAKVKAGVIPAAFDTQWMPYPLTPGVKKTGIFFNYAVNVALDKKDKRLNEIGVRLASLGGDEYFQNIALATGQGVPSMFGLKTSKPEWHMDQLAALVTRDGAYDMGSETARYPSFRPIIMPLLAQFFEGKLDAEMFIKEYERQANEALQEL